MVIIIIIYIFLLSPLSPSSLLPLLSLSLSSSLSLLSSLPSLLSPPLLISNPSIRRQRSDGSTGLLIDSVTIGTQETILDEIFQFIGAKPEEAVS